MSPLGLRKRLVAGVRTLLNGANEDSEAAPDYQPSPGSRMSTMHEDVYKYLPLNFFPTSIRLLSVRPSSAYGAINCTLDLADLATKPQYHALSYTWGPPTLQAAQKGMTDEKRCLIVCNGWEVRVPQNLFDFLCHAAKDSASGPWWIDAICINQENILERNQEILKMRDIYANASHVVVWLGEEDEYTVPALELLTALGSKDPDVLKQVDPLSAYSDTRNKTQNILSLAIEDSDWRALALFYKRAWFSRVWILQECRVAQTTVYLCGNYNVDKEHLLHVALYVAGSYWAGTKGFGALDNDSPENHKPSILSTDYVALVLYHIFYRDHEYGSSLGTAIINSRANYSSDPRDKVYGLLGFFEGSREERESNALMSPDYRKPTSQIYIEAAEYIMRSSGDLSILSVVEDRLYRKTEGLPSWVPDFSATSVTSLGHKKRTTYRASRGLRATWQRRDGSAMLSLRASQIGLIRDSAESKIELANDFCCQHLLRIVSEMDGYYFNGQTRMEALWRTLIEDSGNHRGKGNYKFPAPRCFETAFRSFWLYNAASWLLRPGQTETSDHSIAVNGSILSLLNELAVRDSRGIIPGVVEIVEFAKHRALVDDDFEQHLRLAAPYDAAFSQLSYLRFFRTENSMIGMGPLSLEVGDSVWLVPGSEVLVVLRKRPGVNRYELVGDCYVHGLMDGEAVENALPSMETIELE
ncbi:MAG: hypothetical protein Q9219_006186 [cf. Caloplaca sp. 3 TL-2023]